MADPEGSQATTKEPRPKAPQAKSRAKSGSTTLRFVQNDHFVRHHVDDWSIDETTGGNIELHFYRDTTAPPSEITYQRTAVDARPVDEPRDVVVLRERLCDIRMRPDAAYRLAEALVQFVNRLGRPLRPESD